MRLFAALLALIAVALAAACALADGALLSMDESEANDARGAVLLRRREWVHRALAFARLTAHLLAGALAALAYGYDDRPVGQTVALAVLVAAISAAVAESASRAAGDTLRSKALVRVAPVVRVLAWTLAPLVELAGRLEAWLQRRWPPAEPDEGARESTAERFQRVITPTSLAAAVSPAAPMEPMLGPGVFSLADIEAKDVMVPRVDVVGIERDTPWAEVVARVRSSEHARTPVYEGTLDDIIGILYAKDLLSRVIADAPPADGWLSLVRPAVFIPATKPLDAQLRDFQTSRTHIAIVVDEYGGTAGLITIEDVLEEIVGEIRDEYDVDEPAFEQEDGRRFWVSGRLTLDELSEMLDHDFTREEVSTVGGLVYNLLGRVPKAGETLTVNGFRVVIEQVTRRRVKRVYFERQESLVERASR